MSFFYGWVIVAVGIVVSCIGMGGVMSLGVFLEPMADTLGWSRAGISTASTLAFSMRLNGRYVFRKRVLSFGSGTSAALECPTKAPTSFRSTFPSGEALHASASSLR